MKICMVRDVWDTLYNMYNIQITRHDWKFTISNSSNSSLWVTRQIKHNIIK